MRATLLLALLAIAPGAAACGYCVEDKIASVYDHVVVTRALSQRHHVAFFHLDGAVSSDDGLRKAVDAATRAAPGVDAASVRVVLDTRTVSFSFDPKRASLASLNARIDKALARRGLSLFPMRVMEEAADLKAVPRR